MTVTAASDTQVENKAGAAAGGSSRVPERDYHLTFVESTIPGRFLFSGKSGKFDEPKITVPKEYYRGKVALPATSHASLDSGYS